MSEQSINKQKKYVTHKYKISADISQCWILKSVNSTVDVDAILVSERVGLLEMLLYINILPVKQIFLGSVRVTIYKG